MAVKGSAIVVINNSPDDTQACIDPVATILEQPVQLEEVSSDHRDIDTESRNFEDLGPVPQNIIDQICCGMNVGYFDL